MESQGFFRFSQCERLQPVSVIVWADQRERNAGRVERMKIKQGIVRLQ
jgi:hypothetical protein